MREIGWIDSHSHIASDEFKEDRLDILDHIEKNSISRVMIVCTQESELEVAFSLLEKDDRYDVAYGIHPEDTNECTQERIDRWKEIVKDERIKAIGEIGLDYYWVKDNKEAQKELFITQIKLAQELHKPIIVHARDALQDTYDIMKAYPVKGVMHCYSGSKEMAIEFQKLGYMISLGGPVTFKKAVAPKEVAEAVDIHQFLIETDCPYMSPEPVRGTKNEPMNTKYIGEKVCALREMNEEDLKRILNENYDRLFRSKED